MTITTNRFGIPTGLFQDSVLDKIELKYSEMMDFYSHYLDDEYKNGIVQNGTLMHNGLFANIRYLDLSFGIELSACLIDFTDKIVYTVILYAKHDECSELSAVCEDLDTALERLQEALEMALAQCACQITD